MTLLPSRNPTKYLRVLKFASKPTAHELKVVSAVAGGGITLIGLLGYVIYAVMAFLPM